MEIFDELDSTNDEAKRRVQKALEAGGKELQKIYGAVLIARKQTAGRGRRGRVFVSPGGDSLYISFILMPYGDSNLNILFTAAAAVAVCRAAHTALPEADSRIKWINDVYSDGRKVCGILTEGGSNPNGSGIAAVVLGIGVNINLREEDFPPELQGVAGSFVLNEKERDRFVSTLIENVFSLTDGLGEDGGKAALIDEYRALSLLEPGQEVTVYALPGEGKGIPAEVIGIDDDGGLKVRYADGRQETLRSGEISKKA
ncbi:MAG: biotin--[acetyl-CoA-carboxylase] ligase [Clostridiales bacterium]|nr:biotin--[acetyl-CoA-carboxylase] ligase [Clostridiales bacterium]